MPADSSLPEVRPVAAPVEPPPARSAWSDRELRRRRIIAHYRRFGGTRLARPFVAGRAALAGPRARPAISVQP